MPNREHVLPFTELSQGSPQQQETSNCYVNRELVSSYPSSLTPSCTQHTFLANAWLFNGTVGKLYCLMPNYCTYTEVIKMKNSCQCASLWCTICVKIQIQKHLADLPNGFDLSQMGFTCQMGLT